MSCLFFVSLRKEVFPFLAFVIKRALGIHRLRWRKSKEPTAQVKVKVQGVEPRTS
jgi:hypothetical protein